MDPEVEVSTEPEKKDETPVSFVDDGGETIVTIGKEKEESASRTNDDERWREANANQARLANAFDDLRSRLAGGSGGSHQTPTQTPDPWKPQEDAITEEERALGIQWEAHKASGTFRTKPELLQEFDAKARALQQRRVDIATERAISRAMPQFVAAAQRQQYAAQYGDVQSNPQANQYARGQYDILRAQGHPDSPETVDLAMNAARRAFGLRSSRYQPTERDRDQLSGFTNTRRTNVDTKSNVVKMGKSEKVMAMAMYGNAFNGDEKKVYSTWAKNIGMRAKKAYEKVRSSQR